MKAVATKVISFLACAFVALQAFGFYATYCAWGCNWDWILSAAVAIFSVAVLEAHYFFPYRFGPFLPSAKQQTRLGN